jgi:hypothetical protein
VTDRAVHRPRRESRRESGRRLTLDPGARIIASGDGLHLLHRRGPFELRGKGLEDLHERLAPALDGRWTRAQVLAAAGGHASDVGRYLDGLRESGALREGVPTQALPAGFPAPCAGVQHLTIGRARVAVTLSGDESRDSGALRLSFAPRATVARRFLELEELRSGPGRIWIECDDGVRHDGLHDHGLHDDEPLDEKPCDCEPCDDPRDEELDRRAAIARHLLAIELGRGHEGRLSIFRLASDRCVLQRLAVAARPSMPLDTLPTQLALVQMLDRPQLPLVTMAVDLPGLGRRGIGYGLDAPAIAAMLTERVIGREALLRRIELGTIAGARGDLFQPGPRRADVRLTREDGARAIVASSRARRDEELLQAWARDCANGPGRPGKTIDLLSIDAPSARVAVLQDALGRRQHEPTLPARLDDRLSPLVVVRTQLFVVARTGFEEALAEALVRATAHADGLDASESPDGLACMPALSRRDSFPSTGGPSTRGPSTRRLLAIRRRAAAAAAGPVRVITGHFRFLGATHFFGVLDSGKEGSA